MLLLCRKLILNDVSKETKLKLSTDHSLLLPEAAVAAGPVFLSLLGTSSTSQEKSPLLLPLRLRVNLPEHHPLSVRLGIE